MTSLKLVSKARHFGGLLHRYTHPSVSTKTDMVFSVFFPPAALGNDESLEAKPSVGATGGVKLPVLYYLSGLTCTDENFITKAGAQKYCAERGIILVAPDTSPRGAKIEGEEDNWDFGTGAGFYVDATNSAWSENYNMYSYVVDELPK